MESALPRNLFLAIASVMMTAVGGSMWQTIASEGFSLPFLIALTGLLFASLSLGVVFCSYFRTSETERIDVVHALFGGLIVVNTLLLFFVLSFPFSTCVNFWIILIAGAILPGFKSVRKSWQQLECGRCSLAALLIVLLGSGFWSYENLQSLTISPEWIIAHPWKDMFFHATLVSLFAGSSGADSLSNPVIAGQALPIYHFAGYLIPSVMGSVSGVASYSLATGFYAPLGMLFAGLSAFYFGSVLFNRYAGLTAVIGIMLIPDPSYFFLGNRWTSFFFFQQVGVGGSYGVAVLGLAWAFLFKGISTDRYRLLLGALILFAVSATYKVQLIVVYSFAPLIFCCLFFKRLSRITRVVLPLLYCLSVFILVSFSPAIKNTPTLSFSTLGIESNIVMIIRNFGPWINSWLRPLFESANSYLEQLAIGIPVVLVSTYGIWLPVFALILLVLLRRRSSVPFAAPFAAFICFMLINHLIVALCLAPNSRGGGDAFEIIHKTFVWPYFALVVSTSALVGYMISGCSIREKLSPFIIAATLLVSMIGLFTVSTAGKTVQSGLTWSESFTNTRIPRGLYDSAQFIRQNAAKSAIVQNFDNDGYMILTALGERKSFVLSKIINSNGPAKATKERLNAVSQLFQGKNKADFRNAASALGIDWLVVDAQKIPQSLGDLPAAFESRGYMVLKTNEL